MTARVDIEIPPRSVYVGVVRLAVGSLGRAAGMDEEAVDDLKIAVSEACASAVLDAVHNDDAAPVRVSLHREEDRVEVEVVNPSAPMSEPSAAADSQGFSTRDVMSLGLIEALADSVTTEPNDGGGTITRLTFSLP